MKGPLFFLLIAMLFFSCSRAQEEKSYVIGFSQCVSNDEWRQAMHREMMREMSFNPHLELIIKDANGSSNKQIEQIQEFLDDDINLLIVSPLEAEPLAPIIDRVMKTGIPVIVLDRKISHENYTSHISGDNLEIGRSVGELIKSKIDTGQIIEIWGLPGSTPAKLRNEGFRNSLSTDRYNIIDVFSDWTMETARDQLQKAPVRWQEVKAIYAHNDVMAEAAFQFLESKDLQDSVFLVGTDGLAHQGLIQLNEGRLDATFLYPTGGEEAIVYSEKILSGQEFEKEHLLPTTLINASNVKVLQRQDSKLESQQKDIDHQHSLIDDLERTYLNQKRAILIMGISLLISIGLSLHIFQLVKTARKRQRKYKIAKEHAEEAKKAKENFLSTMSHEIRTPLNAIIGLTEILSLENPRKDQLEHLRLLEFSGNNLLALVNDILDISKIESGKLNLTESEFDLKRLLKNIEDSLRTRTPHLKFFFEYDSTLPEKFIGDELRLAQVVYNLVGNAQKFTKEGSVTIAVTPVEKSESHCTLNISVKDTGIGICDEDKVKIFHSFEQSNHHRAGGTGLGLYITRQILRIMNTDIHFESELRAGSNFYFDITLAKAKVELPVEEVEITNLQSHKILVAEDNTINQFIIHRYMNGRNIPFKLVTDGSHVLEALEQENFSLILMDLEMPNMDGYSTTREIRKRKNASSQIPIIALSAHDISEERNRAIHSGMNDFLSKPFKSESLDLLLRKYYKPDWNLKTKSATKKIKSAVRQ